MIFKDWKKLFTVDLKRQLVYAGVTVPFEDWLYKGVAIGASCAIISYLAIYFYTVNFLISGFSAILVACLVLTVHFVVIFIKAKARSKAIEKVLPDFLELIAGNVQSGMSAYDALKASKRPEFGELNTEVDNALRRVKTTKSLSKAFQEMSNRVDSTTLSRISRLFTTGVRSGAPLGDMLEEIAGDTRDFLSLRRETITTVTAYTSFIMLATILGGPFLFASSIHFLRALGAASGGFVMSDAPIIVPEIQNTELMEKFAYVMMAISSTFVSLLLGLVRGGDEKGGIKYLPPIMVASFGVFYLAQLMLQGFAPL